MSKYKSKRSKYEFSRATRYRLITDYYKNNPHMVGEDLEIHHRVPVWFAIKFGVPSDLIKMYANGQVVTPQEHLEIHENNLSEDEYKVLAQALLGWVGSII